MKPCTACRDTPGWMIETRNGERVGCACPVCHGRLVTPDTDAERERRKRERIRIYALDRRLEQEDDE